MRPGIPPIPLSKRAAVALVILAVVGGGYPLFVEISKRKDAESAVIDRWTDACAAEYGRPDCESEVERLEETCLRQSRDVVRDQVVFEALPFFECMNARNQRGLVLQAPDAG